MACRSSALRASLRLASRRFSQETTRQSVLALASLSHSDRLTSQMPVTISTVGMIHARFSSSDNGKCTEHEVANCSRCTKEVSHDELTKLMQDNLDSLRLVDVRESYELREAGRIPHAVNIPLTQLKGLLSLESELFQEKTGLAKPTKADPIVFYGMGSIRSVAALEIACKMGYKKARHYPGGWQEWSKMQEKSL